jgi:hypothetical protein
MKKIKKMTSFMSFAITALLISDRVKANNVPKKENINDRINSVRIELKKKYITGDLKNMSSDLFLNNKFIEKGWGNWGNWGNWNNWVNWNNWNDWQKWTNWGKTWGDFVNS